MHDPIDDLKWLIGVLIAMGIVWFALGGPSRNPGGPLLNPPEPLGSGGSYSPSGGTIGDELDKIENELTFVEQELKKAQANSASSVYKGLVSLQIASARSDDPDKEHVRVQVSSRANEKIPVSNWRLESPITGRSVALGEGAYLPYSGQVNLQQFIFLSPGDTAIVTTGRSPIGTSFRLNACTGYFEQFQDFTPFLPRQCPRPEDEPVTFGGPAAGFDDECIDFLERLPRCTLQVKALPPSLSSQCQSYINQDVNYSGCVRFHKDDPDFYENQWRIFLGRTGELWKEKREVIKLVDEAGKTVDVISY